MSLFLIIVAAIIAAPFAMLLLVFLIANLGRIMGGIAALFLLVYLAAIVAR